MLTLKLLRDDPEYVIRKLAVKNFDARAIVEKVIALDDNRRPPLPAEEGRGRDRRPDEAGQEG